jgi:hypothetical protein
MTALSTPAPGFVRVTDYVPKDPTFTGNMVKIGAGWPDHKVLTGGTVVIKSTPVGASKPVSRRVSVAPAFDPFAVSMTPIPGWSASDAADMAVAA